MQSQHACLDSVVEFEIAPACCCWRRYLKSDMIAFLGVSRVAAITSLRGIILYFPFDERAEVLVKQGRNDLGNANSSVFAVPGGERTFIWAMNKGNLDCGAIPNLRLDLRAYDVSRYPEGHKGGQD